MAVSFYPDDDPTSSFDNEPTDDEEEDATVINAQETISAAIRLATNLGNRGLLPDVFLRHLRNSVLRLTEPEDDGFEDSLEDDIPPDGSDAPGSQVCCCGRPLGVLQPSRAIEELTLSDSTREFWDKDMRSMARSPPPPPRAAYPGSRYGASQAYTPYRTRSAVPRRLFPDPGGQFPCECESPATPCLVTGPIQWTPSPAGAGPAQTASSPGSSYKGLPLSPRRPVQSRMSSPSSSRGVAPSPGPPCPPECTFAGSSPYTSTASQFMPEINSTNLSGSWGTPSRVTSTRSPVTPAESSYAAEQSSGPIPAWRINADRNAMRGAGGIHSWQGSPRSRSLSPVRRRRQPVAEFEFVPSEDSSMGERSWRSRSSGPRSQVPRVSFPDTTANSGQTSSQCPTCVQSGSSGVMHTFAGFPSSPQVCPLDCRRNWSISPAGAQRGELSREESWRNY